jgi:hypothetical protein
MADLIERLKAAIDDDELAATQCQEHDWRVNGAKSCEVYVLRPDGSMRTIARCFNGYDDDFSNVIHIANQDPARTLAMVAAHRKILDLHRVTISKRIQDPYDAYTGEPKPVAYDVECPQCGWASEDPASGCATLLALAKGYGITP